MKWHLDLYGELSTICIALQVGPQIPEHMISGMIICGATRSGGTRRTIRVLLRTFTWIECLGAHV